MKDKICFITFIILFSVFCTAQKAVVKPLSKVQQVNGVDYEILPGLAEIKSIQLVKKAKESALGYDEYDVLFQFIPMEGHELLEVLKGKKLALSLRYHRSSVRVGAAYIRKMNLRRGTRYAMQLFQTRSGGLNVERYFYQSKILENQLFELYGHLVEELSLTLTFNPDDTTIIKKDYNQLTPAEQRVLIDAELKPIVKDKASEKPLFTQASFDFLKTHSTLLDEYEAALNALAKQEENRYQEQLKEQEEKEQAAKVLAEKIKGIENEVLPSVIRKTTIVRGCYYEVVPGTAQITAIRSHCSAQESTFNYAEHQVLFKFKPDQGYDLLDKLVDKELEFMLYYRGERIHVGPSYIKEKGLGVGKYYPMNLYQKRDGEVCTEQYTYASDEMDNDLFEVLPRRSVLMDTTNVDSLTSQDTSSTLNKETTIMSYDNAKKELKMAQLNKQLGIVNANRVIKLARQKARNLKKIERKRYREERKRLNGNARIELGSLKVTTFEQSEN